MEQKLTQLAILLPSSLHSIASPHFFPFLLLWHALHGLLLALQILYSLQLCVYLFPNAPSSFFTCHKLEKEERGEGGREGGRPTFSTHSVSPSVRPTHRPLPALRPPTPWPSARTKSQYRLLPRLLWSSARYSDELRGGGRSRQQSARLADSLSRAG